ncbi:MAG: thiolase family protein [Dehalococcoidia bacterium]|nr:thiolase family protein [Dehalococcoidia bacterium]
MSRRAAIVGIGQTKCGYNSSGFNHKELLYLATKQALDDAGVQREGISSAFTTSLDFTEGRSLSNQYSLDSIGGVMKPCDLRLGEDGIYGVFAGYMEVVNKPAQIVVVASVQKASDRRRDADPVVMLSTLESNYVRQVCANSPATGHVEYCLAAMEARRYMHCYGITEAQIAKVAVKNYDNATRNPMAQNGKKITVDDVLNSEVLSWPLRSPMVAKPGDGACTLVLASEEIASDLTDKPVWIAGIGWCSDIWYPATSELAKTKFIYTAARQAYAMAGIRHPAREVDLAEVYDNCAFNELQYCEALGLCSQGEGGRFIDKGISEIGGSIPVNPSGGLLGHGNPLGTAGLMRVAQAALQLRGEAGDYQIPNAEVAVAQGCQWPYRSGGVAVLSKW